MSKGLGITQREVLQIVGAAWIDDNQGVLVSTVFQELGDYFKAPSISRAIKSLVEAGKLTRGGEFLYTTDEFQQIERQQIIDRDSGNGLPWWDRKMFQKVKC